MRNVTYFMAVHWGITAVSRAVRCLALQAEAAERSEGGEPFAKSDDMSIKNYWVKISQRSSIEAVRKIEVFAN
jgi:hypothetical protein